MNRFMQTPFVDSERAKSIRLALTKAYTEKDRDTIAKAATEAQKYVDEGGDFDDWEFDDTIEDYKGNNAEMLAEKYLVRLLHDRVLDDDEDQIYIITGLPKFMRMSAQEEIQVIWNNERLDSMQEIKETKSKNHTIPVQLELFTF